VLGAASGLAPTAAAATFCVDSPAGCSGTAESSIANALSAASTNAGTDTIEIAGSHTYNEPALIDAGGNTVHIVGVGTDYPVLTPPGEEPAVLDIEDGNSTVSNLLINMTSGFDQTGLFFNGKLAQNIYVDGGAADGALAIHSDEPGTTVSGAVVLLPATSTIFTTGVELGASNERVENSALSATDGIYVDEGTGSAVTRTKIISPIGVEAADGGAANDRGLDPGRAGNRPGRGHQLRRRVSRTRGESHVAQRNGDQQRDRLHSRLSRP
jgi:hypothetical protein